MQKIITQKEEVCGQCGSELPPGSSAYSDGYDEVKCDSCYDDNRYEDE